MLHAILSFELIILSIQIAVMTGVEPPSSGGDRGAIALIESVVILIFGREGDLVVVISLVAVMIALMHERVSRGGGGVEILDAQDVIPGFVLDAEVVVLGPVVRVIPLFHVNVKRVGAALVRDAIDAVVAEPHLAI